MLDAQGHIKLTDFGSSIRVDSKGEVRPTACATMRYGRRRPVG